MDVPRSAIREAVSKVTGKNMADRKKGTSYTERATTTDMCGAGHVTIRALSDDVLLDIFHFCQAAQVDKMDYSRMESRVPLPAWYTLVHVCQRWRCVVLASPSRLKLLLVCTDRTPVMDMLHIWPPFPIVIRSRRFGAVDNVIAALQQSDRIRRIYLKLRSSQLERLAAVMQKPYPSLTYLDLAWDDSMTPQALPDTFLGGSAPSLQFLYMNGIPFPTLPKLLLSTSALVDLYLWQIPNTGYISPEAMATGLSALTRLEILTIEFKSPASRPDQRIRPPPPPTRAVLPALIYLEFRGVSEYLEDLVARIHAPQLQGVFVTISNQLIFDVQQLPRFISHAGMLRSFERAQVVFSNYSVQARLLPLAVSGSLQHPRLKILCRGLDWQVSSMAQICNQFSFLISSIERLDIFDDDPSATSEVDMDMDMDNTQWLELFQPFTAVRILCISHHLQSSIVSALQGLTGEPATEVLPTLNSVYLEEYDPSGTEQQAMRSFITARQCSGHPVAIHRLETSTMPWELRG
jgi:hypothetical protein